MYNTVGYNVADGNWLQFCFTRSLACTIFFFDLNGIQNKRVHCNIEPTIIRYECYSNNVLHVTNAVKIVLFQNYDFESYYHIMILFTIKKPKYSIFLYVLFFILIFSIFQMYAFSVFLRKYLNIFSYKLTIIVYKLQLCVEGAIKGSDAFIKAIMHKRFPSSWCDTIKKGHHQIAPNKLFIIDKFG